MTFNDYEVRNAFDSLAEAIKLVKESARTDVDRSQSYEDVCIQSRALYARYVDATLWSGSVDEHSYQQVLLILQEALDCLPSTIKDEKGIEKPFPVKESVNLRLNDFKQFSAGLREPILIPTL